MKNLMLKSCKTVGLLIAIVVVAIVSALVLAMIAFGANFSKNSITNSATFDNRGLSEDVVFDLPYGDDGFFAHASSDGVYGDKTDTPVVKLGGYNFKLLALGKHYSAKVPIEETSSVAEFENRSINGIEENQALLITEDEQSNPRTYQSALDIADEFVEENDNFNYLEKNAVAETTPKNKIEHSFLPTFGDIIRFFNHTVLKDGKSWEDSNIATQNSKCYWVNDEKYTNDNDPTKGYDNFAGTVTGLGELSWTSVVANNVCGIRPEVKLKLDGIVLTKINDNQAELTITNHDNSQALSFAKQGSQINFAGKTDNKYNTYGWKILEVDDGKYGDQVASGEGAGITASQLPTEVKRHIGDYKIFYWAEQKTTGSNIASEPKVEDIIW